VQPNAAKTHETTITTRNNLYDPDMTRETQHNGKINSSSNHPNIDDCKETITKSTTYTEFLLGNPGAGEGARTLDLKLGKLAL
jgi:hypothetical protein